MADPRQPGDLDRLIIENMRDPEFVRAWLDGQEREREVREQAAHDRGVAEGRRLAAADITTFGERCRVRAAEHAHELPKRARDANDAVVGAYGAAARIAMGVLDDRGRQVAARVAEGQDDAEPAKGRRQATDGWERRWAIDCGDGRPMDGPEEYIRRHAANSDSGCRAVSRLVGPWEAAPTVNTELTVGAKQAPCPTCSGPIRETVGMVCQTCGTDYAPAEQDVPAEGGDRGDR